MYTNMDGFELVVDIEDQQKVLRNIIEVTKIQKT